MSRGLTGVCWIALLLLLTACGSSSDSSRLSSDLGLDSSEANDADDDGSDDVALLACGPYEVSTRQGCMPVGPPRSCRQGWHRAADHGYCEPQLPPSPCPAATMARLGRTDCAPVGECGQLSIYGQIALTPDTLHVAKGYDGSDGPSDGTGYRPYATIQEAVDALPQSGGHVAVAIGEYPEDIALDKPIVLEGACPEKTIIGGASWLGDVTLAVGEDATIRAFTIHSNHRGVGVSISGAKVTLEQLFVSGCDRTGIEVHTGADVTLTEVSLDNNAYNGIAVHDASLTVRDSVIRDTRPANIMQQRLLGIGIDVVGEQRRAELTISDSLLSDNTMAGIFIAGNATATIERCVVRNTTSLTRTDAEAPQFGWGLFARALGEGSQRKPPTVIVRDSVLSANTDAGILVDDARTVIERTIVRDSRPVEATSPDGIGVVVVQTTTGLSEFEMSNSLVAGSFVAGVALFASGSIERSVIAQTMKMEREEAFGDGVQVISRPGQPAALDLAESLVTDSARAGALFFGASGSVSGSTFQRGLLSVHLEQGARPQIEADNVYQDNTENQVTFGLDLKPSPLPDFPD